MVSSVFKKLSAALTAALGCGFAAGCAQPTGSWTLAETNPKGSPFPFSSMSIDLSGRYESKGFFTSDGEFRNQPQQNDGTFHSSVLGAQLKPSKGPLSYSVSRRWDGKMAISYTPPGKTNRVTAIFAQSPAAPSGKTPDIKPLSPTAMQMPKATQATVKPDPEMSYDCGTKVKLPG